MFRYTVSLILLFTVAPTIGASPVHIAQENMPAVVAVNVMQPNGATFTATGFILTEDGLIATSRHVSQNALYINVTFSDGTVSGEAKEVASSDQVDLALLKIEARHLPTVQVISSAYVLPGQGVTVIGNPRRLQNTITAGLISQIRRKSNGVLLHQISAPISPSSSGSPVFNEQGKVIGIAFGSYSGENNQNLNFSVPSDYLLQLAKQVGYTLPAPPSGSANSANPFLQHIQKSWDILRRLLSRLGPKA
ncbi:MAG: trypsin-like peptidase domain-containing protein [Elusimicrobiaceae bacterium]|nr:trypsin-like peptidase domain-containing protein [Elusimicrobiaceae bacterium]